MNNLSSKLQAQGIDIKDGANKLFEILQDKILTDKGENQESHYSTFYRRTVANSDGHWQIISTDI